MGAGTGAAKKLPCSSALAFLYNLNIDSMHFKIYEKFEVYQTSGA